MPPLEEARHRIEALAVDLYFNLFEGFAGRPETEAMVAAALAAAAGLSYARFIERSVELALGRE